MRVLFLTPYPIEAANTRYRAYQFLPYLKSRGIDCEIASFVSRKLFQELYRRGRFVGKTAGIARSVLGRMFDVIKASHVDVVCISREAMLIGPPVIEWLIHKVARCPMVFDFDDAIFVSYVSPTYGRFASWLRCPWKSPRILEMSVHIIAGNEYLANYARQHNRRVTVLPTVVDTDLFAGAGAFMRPRVDSNVGPVIGWIGTHSTAPYLDLIAPALQHLARRSRFIFRVIGAGRDIHIPGVEVENRQWNMATEIRDFQDLDIGVYPICDDEWGRGKCAFKAIQYMAAGVPCVASPVGMTTEVINSGVNGFHARSIEEWIHYLDLLLIDASLRERLAREGRSTIEKQYSLNVIAPRLADVLEDAAKMNK